MCESLLTWPIKDSQLTMKGFKWYAPMHAKHSSPASTLHVEVLVSSTL